MTDLIVQGGALPTFLLERIAAATGAQSVAVQPPQCFVFRNAKETPAFAEILPLLAAEGLHWRIDCSLAAQPIGTSLAAQGIDALLFDFGNVVVQIDFNLAFAYWGQKANVPAEQIAARFVTSRAYDAHERNEIDGTTYFKALRKELRLELSDTDFLTGWNAIFQPPVSGMPELLQGLAAERPLYLFSNTNAMHHDYWSRAYADLLAPFSRIFCSHELGLRKPTPESFRAVASHIGIAPGQIAFFDDLEENVIGARQVGVQAFQFRGADQVAATLRNYPASIVAGS